MTLFDKNLLKQNWERRQDPIHLDLQTANSLIANFFEASITMISLLSNGCANTNYKIILDNTQTYLLRIYMRDPEAFYREIALHEQLKGKIPVPEVFYSDDACDKIPYPFAIMEYIDGFLMRDIVLQNNLQDIGDCAFSAGTYLNSLRQITYSKPGFFNQSLAVIPFSNQEDYLTLIQSYLASDNVHKAIGTDLTNQLNSFIQANADYLPEQYTANLTHADFDPSNLLVKKINDRYVVSAILDWEFAFVGTYLFDIGLFLRYSHKLPAAYEQKFIEGIIAENDSLPPDWKKSAKLLDLLSLLSILDSKDSINRPNLIQDITALFDFSINNWDQF